MNILNKKGYALTYTVIVIAILSILGISLLYASSINYRIKIGDKQTKDTLYKIDGAQREIKALIYAYIEDEIFAIFSDGMTLEELQEAFERRVQVRNDNWVGGLSASSRIKKDSDAIAYKLFKKDDEARILYGDCKSFNVQVSPKYREQVFICMQVTVYIRTSLKPSEGSGLRVIYEIYKPEILPSMAIIKEDGEINTIFLYDITKNMLKTVKWGG